jgi:hypothetical protein
MDQAMPIYNFQPLFAAGVQLEDLARRRETAWNNANDVT